MRRSKTLSFEGSTALTPSRRPHWCKQYNGFQMYAVTLANKCERPVLRRFFTKRLPLSFVILFLIS